MFKLYIDKKNLELKIEPLGNLTPKNITDTPTFFNDCYMVCTNRKALKEKAIEIQEQWIKEAEEYLEKVKSVKIKSKY